MIRLNGSQINQINTQSELEYPDECCGILLGHFQEHKSKIVEYILPISNARAAEDKHNRFLITADEMMGGELFAYKNKMVILGFYHSHPDHPAIPSQYDLEHAWPLYSYIITSVIKGKVVNLTSWELKNDRSQFDSEWIVKGD